MDFQQVAENFERAGSGTDDFKALFKEAFGLMKIDPENAGAYFVIGIAARSYVHRYEDQGITPEFADRAKATLVGLNAKIIEGLRADAATRLRLLGEIAIEYEWNVSDF